MNLKAHFFTPFSIDSMDVEDLWIGILKKEIKTPKW